MPDTYAGLADTVTSPSGDYAAVVPHDTNPLPRIPKSIFVGSGGTIVTRGQNSAADVSHKFLQPGSELAIRPMYIRATGTTATDIVAYY